jgi:hypothetical protein
MSRVEVDVKSESPGPPYVFRVEIKEGTSSSKHRVTLSESSYRELTGGAHSPEECVRLAFRFLLDREPKESILSKFDVDVIEKYFPDFRREMARAMGGN